MFSENNWVDGFISLTLAITYELIYNIFYLIGYFWDVTLYTLFEPGEPS